MSVGASRQGWSRRAGAGPGLRRHRERRIIIPEREVEITDGDATETYIVDEVVHFGGFFQGDTVGLKAHPIGSEREPATLTIDDAAWSNLTEKHELSPGIALELSICAGEVVGATVLGHADREQLRRAIRREAGGGAASPRALAYRCERCGLWIAREPARAGGRYACAVCGQRLA